MAGKDVKQFQDDALGRRAARLMIDDDEPMVPEAKEPTVIIQAPKKGEGSIDVLGAPGIYEGDVFATSREGFKGPGATARAMKAFEIPEHYYKLRATHPETGEPIPNANWMVVKPTEDTPGPGKILGWQPVSDGYEIIKPETFIPIMDGMLAGKKGKDGGEVAITKGGTWNDDAVIWLQSDHGTWTGPNGEDYTLRALISNSYDRSSAFTFSWTNINAICLNYFRLALKTAKSQFKIKHTKSASAKVKLIETALAAGDEYQEQVQNTLMGWKRTTITMDQAAVLARIVLSIPAEPKVIDLPTRSQNRLSSFIEESYIGAKGADPNNLYGFAMGVTHHSTHRFGKVTGLEGLETTGAGAWQDRAIQKMVQHVQVLRG